MHQTTTHRARQMTPVIAIFVTTVGHAFQRTADIRGIIANVPMDSLGQIVRTIIIIILSFF